MFIRDMFRQLDTDWNRLFDTGMRAMRPDLPNGAVEAAPLTPALDVVVRGDELALFVELPGVDPGSIDVEVVDGTLTVRARRAEPALANNERYVKRERRVGEVMRAVKLPYRVDAERVEARYVRGVLEVTLPRHADTKPRRIPVQTVDLLGEGAEREAAGA